jgi:hypothetical protein
MEEKKEDSDELNDADAELEEDVMEQDPGFQEAKEEAKKDAKKKPQNSGNIFKKIYNFLWVSENPWSYVAFIIVAFILLRFIVFPVFLYSTGYSDVAAVVSGSMRHDGVQFNHTFGTWLEFNGFTQEELSKWPYQDGLAIGDVIFVKVTAPEDIKVGDVVLFNSRQGQIIHRVVFIDKVNNEYFYTTKGDANPAISSIEKNLPYSSIKGELVNKIPFLGYPKVVLNYIIPGV